MCTSIVLSNSEGRVIHGRNWDFEFFRDLTHISFHLDVYKNGTYLYEADGLAGSVFFVTGMKPGKFGISVNARKSGYVWDNLYRIFFTDNMPAPWLVRETLE